MARKTKPKTIVAIAAHPKMNPGDVFVYAEWTTEEVTLVTRPYWKGYNTFPGGSWWIKYQNSKGSVFNASLGDSGVLGFAYDSRPSRFVKTLEEGKLAVENTEKWRHIQDMEDPHGHDPLEEIIYTEEDFQHDHFSVGY